MRSVQHAEQCAGDALMNNSADMKTIGMGRLVHEFPPSRRLSHQASAPAKNNPTAIRGVRFLSIARGVDMTNQAENNADTAMMTQLKIKTY